MDANKTMYAHAQSPTTTARASSHLAVLEHADCNLCGSRDFKQLFAATLTPEELLPPRSFLKSYQRPRHHLQILRCRRCSLVQVNPRLRDTHNISHYEELRDPKYLTEHESLTVMGRKVLRRIERWTPPGRLLDVGCAAGYLLQAAKEGGWDVAGIEPSRWAVEQARSAFRIPVYPGPLEAMGWPAESFDAIVLSDVIEHLHDPRRTLQEVHRLLQPSGVLYLSTPRFGCFWSRVLGNGWWGIIPAHNFFFSYRTLQDMLDRTGFRSLIMGTGSRTYTVEYWLEQCSSYSPGLARRIKAIAGQLRLLHRPWSLNLGDQIVTVASKLGKSD